MSFWQPNDLALCIKSGGTVTSGRVYVVDGVHGPFIWGGDRWEGVGLTFVGHRWDENAVWGGSMAACYFVKVTPPEADEFDIETIALLNREPVNLTSQSERTLALDGWV